MRYRQSNLDENKAGGRQAFTLVELIVVIVVLGILSGIAVMGYKVVVNKSNDAKQSATMTQVLKEAKALYVQLNAADKSYSWEQAIEEAVADLPTYAAMSTTEGAFAASSSNGWTVRADSGDNIYSASANDIVIKVVSGTVCIATALSASKGVFGMVSQYTAPFVWVAACSASSCDATSASAGPPSNGSYAAGTTVTTTSAPATTSTTTTTTTTTTIPTGSTAPVGALVWYSGSTAPSGWVKADGAAFSRTSYSAAFTAMSTTYGSGDGSTTFNVPDATGRALVGKDSTQSEFDTLGETGGSSSVTLTTANLPAHDHSFSVSVAANTSEYATTSFMRLVGVSGTSSYFNHMPGYAGGGYADYGDTQFPQHCHPWSASASSTTSSTGSSGAHNNLQPYIALTALVAVSSTAVLQPGMVLASSDSGSIPAGWSIADGSAISRTSNASLFAVSGTSFGSGDGSTTFNSPNLKGRTPVGVSASQTAFDTLGETGGAKSHTLVSAEMPAHNHAISLSASGNTSETPRSSSMRSVAQVGTWMNQTHMVGWAGGAYADTSGPFPQHSHAINVTTSATSGSTGGSTSHNELQPYKAVRYLVATSSAPLLSSGMLLNVASSTSVPAAYSADMAGRLGVGVDSSQTEFDLLGETGGTKTESLTTAQTPAHNHTASLNFVGSTSETATASWNRITQQPGTNQCCDHRPGYSSGYYEDYSGAFPQHYHAITISASGSTSPAVGSGTAHQNLQPYLVTQVWNYSGSGSTSSASVFALASSGDKSAPQSPPYGPLVIAASVFAWISVKKRLRTIPGAVYAA